MRRGDDVLLVGEDHRRAFFDSRTRRVLATAVRELGDGSQIVIAPETDGLEDVPDEVARAMARVDHTIFVSRLGDQVRPSEIDGLGTRTTCYLHDTGYLRRAFARVP